MRRKSGLFTVLTIAGLGNRRSATSPRGCEFHIHRNDHSARRSLCQTIYIVNTHFFARRSSPSSAVSDDIVNANHRSPSPSDAFFYLNSHLLGDVVERRLPNPATAGNAWLPGARVRYKICKFID